MKTKLLLPAIFLATISLAYAGGRTPPANGNSNSSKPTQAEVTGEPSKGGSFQDDGSEGIGGDPGTPAEANTTELTCKLLEAELALFEAYKDEFTDWYGSHCMGAQNQSDSCQETFQSIQEINSQMLSLKSEVSDLEC